MNKDDFKFYHDFLLARSGLFLTAEKTYLLETRLKPLSRTLGFDDLAAYTRYLRQEKSEEALTAVIEAMTTNETSFFRDIKPFHHLRHDFLPYFFEKRAAQKRLRLWSAAASSGQEAYSIAMILREMADKISGWNIDILGTDIADTVLQQARRGEYNNFEIQRGLSMPMIVRHFHQTGASWTIKDELRRMVSFRKFNLLDPVAPLSCFDLIFCRNVLIYFSPEKKLQVLQSLATALMPDGILILGSCEGAMGEQSGFMPHPAMHGAYVKKDQSVWPAAVAGA